MQTQPAQGQSRNRLEKEALGCISHSHYKSTPESLQFRSVLSSHQISVFKCGLCPDHGRGKKLALQASLEEGPRAVPRAFHWSKHSLVREVGNGAKKTQASLRAPMIWSLAAPDLSPAASCPHILGPLGSLAVVQTIQTHAHVRTGCPVR